jgi:hypothetical protein
MKKDYVLGILFFSGLWGISEAVLGDALYSANVPYASVPLTVIGFILMAVSQVYFPQKGTATLIAGFAMLYKFLNVPFFACHLLGIVLMGLCYDLFFNVLKIKNRPLSAIAAVYLNYVLFALMITYVFRYETWVQGGFVKILRHIGISGSMVALSCAILIPASLHFGQKFKANFAGFFSIKPQVVPGSVLAITIGLWIFGIAAYIF